MSTKSKSKKEKTKIGKLIEKSDSDDNESEHELSYYINDRVKLMKEVLKIIKPKKIKNMAPDCIKNLDIEEINSMLLEELLGISNKRLKYIFNGQNPGEDSSSTDPEEEKQSIDVISLDDISDDDFVVEVDTDKYKKTKKIKTERKIKQEKHDKSKKVKHIKEPLQEENLMSVLELLELQARARAIRSQLMLETNKQAQEKDVKIDDDSDTDDAVIIELPKHDEIVITSSDSENEQDKDQQKNGKDKGTEQVTKEAEPDSSKKKKIKLIRNRLNSQENINIQIQQEAESEIKENETMVEHDQEIASNQVSLKAGNKNEVPPKDTNDREQKNTESIHDDDEIILIVDQEEMDGMVGE